MSAGTSVEAIITMKENQIIYEAYKSDSEIIVGYKTVNISTGSLGDEYGVFSSRNGYIVRKTINNVGGHSLARQFVSETMRKYVVGVRRDTKNFTNGDYISIKGTEISNFYCALLPHNFLEIKIGVEKIKKYAFAILESKTAQTAYDRCFDYGDGTYFSRINHLTSVSIFDFGGDNALMVVGGRGFLIDRPRTSFDGILFVDSDVVIKIARLRLDDDVLFDNFQKAVEKFDDDLLVHQK
ncbi:MAG: hypothetical protein HQL42_15870 [Alphaproteobacteria bacterium]|nr:hypothetical protein [Alphaproteobacteria bacterium]